MRYLLFLIILIFGTACSVQASPWTEGEKKVLYIRCDFSDLPGDPVTNEYLQKALTETRDFYYDNSYGKTTLKFTVTPTLRMPETAVFYGNIMDSADIIRHAREAARAAGYETKDYELEIVAFKTPKGDHGGVAGIGHKGMRLKNNFASAVTVHELGHNFGLPHAKGWKTNDGSVIGPGQVVDFGDPHDWMGGGGGRATHHLSVPMKAKLGWINDKVEDVKTSGIYRIYAHDLPNAPGLRGLKIKRNYQHIYWVEFRQLIQDVPALMNGVRLVRSYTTNNEVDVLDTTPDSPHSFRDAALLIGRTYTDEEYDIHITPIRKGGTQPESMDVAVYIGKFTENRAPVLSVEVSTTKVGLGQEVEFKATATDADGDQLSYYWDFGDGNATGGMPQVSHAWNGEPAKYVVRCTASDMKGGTASRSIIVELGNLEMEQISGKVTLHDGKPLQDVKVGIGGKDYILTDSDGNYTLVNLHRTRYTVQAKRLGYVIEPVVKATSIMSGPDSRFDFVAYPRETISPVVTTDMPDYKPEWRKLPPLSGTAVDNPNGSGVERVTVVVQRERDGYFWTGRGWDKPFTEVPANLEGEKWSISSSLPQSNMLSSGDYIITPIAYDKSGNTSIETPQRAGSAMGLDGHNDAIEIKNISGLPEGKQPFSIEAWLYLAGRPEYRAWTVMLGAPQNGAMHWFYNENALLNVGVWGGGKNRGQLNVNLPLKKWVHVVCSFDGQDLKVYLDGVLKDSTPSALNLKGTHFMIGKQPAGFTDWQRLAGMVDEVRVWNKALSETEIKQNMYRQLNTATPGLVLSWNLDDPQSKAATDSSGNNNHGVITENPLWLSANSVRVTSN